jgi:L-gulono-1,4-lactone dehydrogenase
MSTTKFEETLLKAGNEINEEESIEQLVKLVKSTNLDPTDSGDEEGDEVPEINNLIPAKDLEFEFKEDEFITNPAATWDFAKPVTIIFPHSLRGIVNAVKFAEARNMKIKALGARHSFSLAPSTDDCYVDLSKTFKYSSESTMRDYDQSSLNRTKEGTDKGKYFDLPAGINIYMINHILCSDIKNDKEKGNKRMYNMGGGDVQTFAGAFSTGTHGSGGKYSAYHDMIRSIVIVCSEGRAYRVEPSDGITDPESHLQYYKSNPELVPVELIQEDDKFYSLLVSMGCFGVIYSAIIEITDMTLLHAESTYIKQGWNKAFTEKFKKPVLPLNPEEEYFYYIQMNPYKLKGKNAPSIIVKEVRPTKDPGSGKRETRKKLWPSVFSSWPVSVKFIRSFSNSGMLPRRRLIESALKSQNDNKHSRGKGYTDIAYRIWNAGSGRMKSIGTAIEVAFPVEKLEEVMKVLIASFQKVAELKRGYCLNAPIALRFVRPSKAYLAPNYYGYEGREVKEWCYIELLRVNSKDQEDDERETKIFQHFQLVMNLLRGRPHWGLNFRFNFDQTLLKKLYPKYDQWIESYLFFNSNGTFDNEFTRKTGFRQEVPIIA